MLLWVLRLLGVSYTVSEVSSRVPLLWFSKDGTMDPL